MKKEIDFISALESTDYGPIKIKVDRLQQSMVTDQGLDATIKLSWRRNTVKFKAVFKRIRSMRDIMNTSWQFQRSYNLPEEKVLLVVPFLPVDGLQFLRDKRINTIDLSGNGTIEVDGKWFYYRQGMENKYPTDGRTKAPYKGKSALVGRAFMMRSSYSSVGEIQEEIVARNERISLSQVSKVLSAMEADLVIDKTSENIRLIQPEKLLDLLVEGYSKPKVLGSLRISEQPTPKFLDYLGKKAKAAGTSIAVYDPKRYVVGPESDDLLEIYVRASSATDLEQLFDITPSDRFVKAEIKAVADAGLFLDAFKEKSGIGWCSNLEVYLRLMQGGKRARETAAELRNDIIGTTRARMQN